jgi:hypothetical protein
MPASASSSSPTETTNIDIPNLGQPVIPKFMSNRKNAILIIRDSWETVISKKGIQTIYEDKEKEYEKQHIETLKPKNRKK